MRGLPQFNFPAFDAATKALRERGFEVFSPAERDRQDPNFTFGDAPHPIAHYMAIDLPEVCKADILILLPGWEKSEGANIEFDVAKKLGKQVYAFVDGHIQFLSASPTPTDRVGPNRASTLPTGSKERKQFPVASGVLDYFPDAIAAISHVSWKGNEQHNPGQPLHWARDKSNDQGDTMIRHFLERGKLDTDGMRHSAKMAWRALALLQEEIEAESRA